jgi:DNA anti-recombination protein RmuC
MFFFTFTNEGSHVINERMDELIEQMKPDDVTKEITDKFVKIKDKVEGFFDKNADKIKNSLKKAGYKIKDLTTEVVGKFAKWLD